MDKQTWELKKMKNNRNKSSIKRRFVTLIEMMIVMFLIALITGVVAYNYRGSLDEGKAFKTKAGMDKLETILSLVMADDSSANISDWKNMIENSPMVKNPNDLIYDGWGQEYQVTQDPDGRIIVHSSKYDAYLNKNSASMFKKDQ